MGELSEDKYTAWLTEFDMRTADIENMVYALLHKHKEAAFTLSFTTPSGWDHRSHRTVSRGEEMLEAAITTIRAGILAAQGKAK